MKPFRIIGRSIRDAFKSVFRNFSLSIASILCATITLMVVAIATVVALNVRNATQQLESELSIVVYVERGTTDTALEYLENELKNINGVAEVKFISNDERLLEMSNKDSSFSVNFEIYEENPLLDAFVVYVKNPEDLENTTAEIRKKDNVESADYGKDTVDTIVTVFDVVEKATVVVVIALVLVTAFLITNTIKLAIYARRNEIEIMRLVGASNLAIKMPFVFEGFTIGLLGSIIPIIITIYGYIIAFEKLGGKIIIDNLNLIGPYNFIFYISLGIALLGAVIGMFGSLLAVRRYLKI